MNISHLIGELKFDDLPSSTTSDINSNNNGLSSLMSIVPERTRFPRRMRPAVRSRGGRGIQHSSHLIETSPRNNNNNNHHRNGR